MTTGVENKNPLTNSEINKQKQKGNRNLCCEGWGLGVEGLRWWKCLSGGGIWQRWGSDSGPTPSGMALGGGGGQSSSTQPRGLLKCLWLQCA